MSSSLQSSASNWVQNIPTTQSYALNKVLFDLHHKPEHLQRYRLDPDAYLQDSHLEPALREALIGNDVAQLYLAGANPYLLRAHCIGIGIPDAVSVAALKSLMHKTG